MEMNEILERLPKHLLSLVIDQPYNSYTVQDHALWRYVMRQNVRYLSKVAHGSYLDGLRKTGISLDRIPMMYGMNRILREIGWAAVAVDGFIPPSAFMEFQAYNVLVIAADIRPIDQIGYTSAPDIIHEAAGHAPIIADPVYAGYLRRFGEIGCKAFPSGNDYRMYEAIRHLSILKADPYSNAQMIEEAEKAIELLGKNLGEPSELAQIRNLHWWTVEYGLIGELSNPQIYGAGLLSSIAESYYCMQPKVKKIPYSLDAVNYSFDITEPQPQLFVTPDFETLNSVLDEFTRTMALSKGGVDGIRKAIRSENTGTSVYSSGLQVSGTFTDVIEKNGEPVYIRTTGLTNLNFSGKEIPGHDKQYHRHGFSSPVGWIMGLTAPPEDATDDDLSRLGFSAGKSVEFEFESGLKVRGIFQRALRKEGKLILLSFSECEVTFEGTTLYQLEWGPFDMAVGSSIVSCFSGPADPVAFGLNYPVPSEKTHKIEHTEKAIKLFSLYQKVRDLREQTDTSVDLSGVWEALNKDHPGDWLCALEILELLKDRKEDPLYKEINDFLQKRSAESEIFRKLIEDGLVLIED
ncbi:MAG: aromatic amino acid hydroxylase [Bacteroidetes bacterium]|nr:aromatic amino acid hydroxylase [Bacteroidota bacterium]